MSSRFVKLYTYRSVDCLISWALICNIDLVISRISYSRGVWLFFINDSQATVSFDEIGDVLSERVQSTNLSQLIGFHC